MDISERGRRFVGVNEVAAYLGMKVPTIYAWVSRERIQHYKLGGKSLRFDLYEIDKWMEQFKIERNPRWDEVDGATQKG